MRPDLIRELFEKETTYWWNVSKRGMVLLLARDMLRNQLTENRKIAVDMGCGTGFTALSLQSHYHTVGVDVSREALQFCKRRGLKRLCQINQECYPLPFKTGAFDLILALDVIEHMEDDLRTLSEYCRILKVGGSLIVTVPAFMTLWSPWDEALGHRRRYTVSMLAEKIQQAGLTTRRITYMFFFIFPIALLIRGTKKLIQRDAASYSSDFIPLPKILNSFLILVGGLEQWITTKLKLKLPLGLSVICVATKRETPQEEPLA